MRHFLFKQDYIINGKLKTLLRSNMNQNAVEKHCYSVKSNAVVVSRISRTLVESEFVPLGDIVKGSLGSEVIEISCTVDALDSMLRKDQSSWYEPVLWEKKIASGIRECRVQVSDAGLLLRYRSKTDTLSISFYIHVDQRDMWCESPRWISPNNC